VIGTASGIGIMPTVPDLLQRTIGLMGGVITLPLVAALALAIRLDSHGPAIFSAPRLGAGGIPFRVHKLRTMVWHGAASGSAVTVAADPRLTRLGRLLRRYRLDELPQLWNVARGEMRLVGPRPEDPRFVDFADPLHREVFTARPGLTGLAQLVFVDEASAIDPANPEGHYRDAILPAKLQLDAAYLRNRTARLDLWILAQTPRAILGRRVEPPAHLRGARPDA
jgi:lipopolysaccharide/colanic/teichoic acid biosynthesis glycosyltransferase